MPSFDVNWLAVGAATVWMMVLGSLWYGPIFGKTWMAALGKTREEMGSQTSALVISIAGALVAALVLAVVLGGVGADSVAKGIAWGILIAVGFVVTSTMTNAAYEAKSSTITTLFAAYQIIGLAGMGAIITALG